MAFPSTGLLTSFTGTDEDPLSEGGLWAATSVRPLGGGIVLLRRVSNTAFAQATAGTGEQVIAQSYAADMEVYMTVTTVSASGTSLHCRVQNPGAAGVVAYTLSYVPGTGFRYFYRSNSTTAVQVGATRTDTISAGDGMGWRIQGTTLEGFKKVGGVWSSLGTETDTNIAGSGQIGVGIVGLLGQIDDFGGGAVSSGLMGRAQVLSWLG